MKTGTPKGFTALEIVLVVGLLTALAAAGYFAYSARQAAVKAPEPQVQTGETGGTSVASRPEEQAPARTCAEESDKAYDERGGEVAMYPSPDGRHLVTGRQLAGGTKLTLWTSDCKLILSDLPIDADKKIMGLGTRIPGQYAFHFDGWKGNDGFGLKVNNAEGHEYLFTFGGATGRVNPNSFKQLK